MMTSYMVDSASPIPAIQTPPPVGGVQVSAWGRYLGDGGGAATPMTAEEAQVARERGIAILPVFNDSARANRAVGYAGGRMDGETAVRQAQAIGIPSGVCLVLDLESPWFPIQPSYLKGWADPVAGAGYDYMLYSSLGSLRTWFLNFPPEVYVGIPSLRLWVANWIGLGPVLPTWGTPDPCPWGAPVAAWQFADGGQVDHSVYDPSLVTLWHPAGAGSQTVTPAPVQTPSSLSLQDQIAALQKENAALTAKLAAIRSIVG